MSIRRAGPLGVLLLAIILPLAGCGDDDDESTKPAARELTRDDIGHYCNMIVADHLGPKGQIFLKSQKDPVWFSSVRDTIAFTMLPEEPKDIAAIYVNDMAKASWDSPEPGTWIDARKAWYVIESDRVGGMGAPEAVPFSDKAAAEAFAAQHGGRVLAFADVPEDFILGGVETASEMSEHEMSEHEMQGHGMDASDMEGHDMSGDEGHTQ